MSLGNFKRSKTSGGFVLVHAEISDSESKYNANPLLGREPDSPERAAREAKAAQEHKEHKMKILKTAARDKEYRHLVELDAKGEPIWKEEKHGQFVGMATRIDRAIGKEVVNV